MRLAGFAGGNDALFVDGLVVLLVGIRGGDAGIVLRQRSQRTHEPVAEIALEREPLRIHHRAIGVLKADIANRAQGVRGLVVDDLVREQNVVVLINLDVAPGDDPVVAVVVDQVVRLKQQRRCLVRRDLFRNSHLRRRRLLSGRLLLRECGASQARQASHERYDNPAKHPPNFPYRRPHHSRLLPPSSPEPP